MKTMLFGGYPDGWAQPYFRKISKVSFSSSMKIDMKKMFFDVAHPLCTLFSTLACVCSGYVSHSKNLSTAPS